MRLFGQDEEFPMDDQGGEPVALPSPDGGQEYYNVSEQAVLYDTIGITADLPNLSKQPPGWFSTFALAGGAVDHSFFNVRNLGNCDSAYTNMDTRDQTAFAFRATGLGLSFWAQTWGSETAFVDGAPDYLIRRHLPNAIWQLDLPIHASVILKLQQDERTKINAAMLTPGYGVTGGGTSNYCGGTEPGTSEVVFGQCTAASQGIPEPASIYRFPNLIDIPRRASLSAVLSFSEWARQLLQTMPGPIECPYTVDVNGVPQTYPVFYGITAVLYGRRLVQQRGALRA